MEQPWSFTLGNTFNQSNSRDLQSALEGLLCPSCPPALCRSCPRRMGTQGTHQNSRKHSALDKPLQASDKASNQRWVTGRREKWQKLRTSALHQQRTATSATASEPSRCSAQQNTRAFSQPWTRRESLRQPFCTTHVSLGKGSHCKEQHFWSYLMLSIQQSMMIGRSNSKFSQSVK